MIYAVGSRVRFIHTGYEGVVTAQLGDDMLSVLLDDGDEIPAFEDDLMRIEDYRAQLRNKTPIKAKVVKGKQLKEPKKPDLPEIKPQYSILKSLGIQLAFEAHYKSDGTTSGFKIHLINDTPYDVLYSFNFQLGGLLKLKSNGKIESVSFIEMGDIPYDYLNESPVIDIEGWQVTTEGTGKRLHKSIKLKAKQFFRKLRTAPLLNLPVYHYIVFDNFDVSEKTGEDLKTYTSKNTRLRYVKGDLRKMDKHSVSELANFNPELDLHIEKHTDRWEKMNNAEILRFQIQLFDEYIEKAIKLGVPRVFIIHGLGKGRLRNDIASRLIRHPDVETFKNEFHPRYGHGATEVIFK